jgi:hypothetical protein
MQVTDKFVAFVDIIGFSSLVEAAERDSSGDLSRPKELIDSLLVVSQFAKMRERGTKICPTSRRVANDLDHRFSQVSDCIIISSEISPAGAIAIVEDCFQIAFDIMEKGALCRGFLTRGNIYHAEDSFIGTGYMTALKNEPQVKFLSSDGIEKGTPFIQVDTPVVDYIGNEGDACVRKMFDRMCRSDGTYTAIYPFGPLARIPSALVRPGFDPSQWRLSVVRSLGLRKKTLAKFMEAEQSAPDERARRKNAHYRNGIREAIDALNKKLQLLDEMIATGKIRTELSYEWPCHRSI